MIVKRLVTAAFHLRKQNQEIRKIAIVAAESVTEPTANTRPSGQVMPCQKPSHRRCMVDLVSRHGLDETQLVGDRPDVRQPVADRRPRFTMPPKR